MELLARPDGFGSFFSTSSRSCTCVFFGPRGLCVMVGSRAQFRSGLATRYVWLTEKVKCG